MEFMKQFFSGRRTRVFFRYLYKWFDILVLYILSISISYYIFLVFFMDKNFLSFISGEGFLGRCLYSFILGYILYRLVLKAKGVRYSFGVKTSFRNPPFWFLLIFLPSFISIFLLYKSEFGDEYLYRDFLIGFSFLWLGFSFSGVVHKIGDAVVDIDRCNDFPVRGLNFDDGILVSDGDKDFISWIFDESPICIPEKDLYGMSVYAKRIAGAIAFGSANSIGVLGLHGTGKTSVVNLVEYYLSNDSSRSGFLGKGRIKNVPIFCRIESWGLAPGAVANKILEESIDKVSNYVDCSSIVSLPNAYRISSYGKWGGVFDLFLSIFSDVSSPYLLLRRLDYILDVSGLILIIVLEDVDRIGDKKVLSEEVPALMDKLSALRRVSFVLTADQAKIYPDAFIRVFDKEEIIG